MSLCTGSEAGMHRSILCLRVYSLRLQYRDVNVPSRGLFVSLTVLRTSYGVSCYVASKQEERSTQYALGQAGVLNSTLNEPSTPQNECLFFHSLKTKALNLHTMLTILSSFQPRGTERDE
jgi:hypothetical protein